MTISCTSPRTALVMWAMAVVAVATFVSMPGKQGKLYATFVAAGNHFRTGEPLYGEIPEGQDQYRYSPLVAAAFAPWGQLPTPVGAVLWRAFEAAVYLLALRAWTRVAAPPVPWPVLALLTLPLVLGNVYNAQLNPLVAALMLASVAAFASDRLWLAAAAIAGAAAVKVYPLALGLLLTVVEPRRFGPRLAVAVAIGCGLPFALQSPEYVTQQFTDWAGRVGDDDRTEQPMERGYHDFQKVLRRWGLPTPLDTYRVMEVIAGAAAAGLVLWGRWRGQPRDQLIHTCAGLGFVWCTLFGPATESATYMLLATTVAHASVAVVSRPLWERVTVWGAMFLLASVPIAMWFSRPISDPYRALIPQGHGALLLLGWLVWDAVRGDERDRMSETPK